MSWLNNVIVSIGALVASILGGSHIINNPATTTVISQTQSTTSYLTVSDNTPTNYDKYQVNVNNTTNPAKTILPQSANQKSNTLSSVVNQIVPIQQSHVLVQNMQSSNSQVQSTNMNGISSCQEITNPGTYTIVTDITDPIVSNTSHTCLNIHDTNNVYLNCAGHTVNSVSPLNINNVSHFSISSCNFKGQSGSGQFFISKISNGTYGDINNNTFDSKFNVSDSSSLKIHNNTFYAPWIQAYTNNSLIQNNNFILNIDEYHTVQSLIESDRGSDNQFTGNKIDGGSDSVYATEIGADDGIFFADENTDVIKNNDIQKTFNCGIESSGVISNTTIDSNSINGTGYCGIGAWYYNSWISNVVSNNVINSAHKMFYFIQDYGLRPYGFDSNGLFSGHSLPADTGVYFQNNQFINNRSTDNSNLEQTRFDMDEVFSTGRNGEITPSASQYILQNNSFKNNNFGMTSAVVMIPSSMIVDGGGNICLSTENGQAQLSGTYPINCSGQYVAPPVLSTTTPATSTLVTTSPSCNLYSDKTYYVLGDAINFSWTSQNATYASWQSNTLNLSSDKLSANGTQEVTANALGSFSIALSIYGNNGSNTCSTIINITTATSTGQELKG